MRHLPSVWREATVVHPCGRVPAYLRRGPCNSTVIRDRRRPPKLIVAGWHFRAKCEQLGNRHTLRNCLGARMAIALPLLVAYHRLRKFVSPHLARVDHGFETLL